MAIKTIIMEKAGKILKLGLVIFSATSITTAVHAQSGTGNVNKAAAVISSESEGRNRSVENKTAPNQPSINNSQSGPEFIFHAAGSVNPVSSGTGARNCESKNISKPNSITRDNFNKLPKDRQQFVLNNLNKYSIVD